ncbi:MAG: hypothetical protein V2A66_10135 [Pseudomonadota bacterium]
MADMTSAEGIMATLDDPLYRQSYSASIAVHRNIAPYLSEGDDTGTKLGHSAREVPRLIAAGLHSGITSSCKAQALGEAALRCTEAIVMLSFCRDLHGRFINGPLCADLIETYRSVGDELSRLAAAAGPEGKE